MTPTRAQISNVKAPRGGVMTVEAGAITGDLVVETKQTARGLVVRAGYAGSVDRYRVEGSPVQNMGHADVVRHLRMDPGLDEYGNPAASSLQEAKRTGTIPVDGKDLR